MREATLKDCLPNSDEARCYYGLYGDLYFDVPHYVIKYEVTDQIVKVHHASGCKTAIGRQRFI